MSNPTVLCVMLANGRQEMVNRAVESWRAQAYEEKRLLVLDTGDPLVDVRICRGGDALRNVQDLLDIYIDRSRSARPETIGALRNRANAWAQPLGADIIAHFDSDDHSHANRLAEQVALLTASGADAVGYNQALFWQDAVRYGAIYKPTGGHVWPIAGQAWLYTSPKSDVALGGTLLYWRRTWEQKRFPNEKHGEDTSFQTGMRVAAVSGVPGLAVNMMNIDVANEPRFIAHIHGANTSSVITPTVRDWRRVPEADAMCAEKMKL